jgi:hypothetical protein
VVRAVVTQKEDLEAAPAAAALRRRRRGAAPEPDRARQDGQRGEGERVATVVPSMDRPVFTPADGPT